LSITLLELSKKCVFESALCGEAFGFAESGRLRGCGTGTLCFMVCEIAADVERLDERSVLGFRGVLRHEQDAIRAHQLRTCSLSKSGGTAGKG
jgi:hypothetical protein